MKISGVVCLMIVLASFFMFVPSQELLAAPYYQGKVITIIVGYGAGGGYDRMARLLAKHLPKHIPGKPTILVENMPGADSIIAANHLYNIAKPDGLTIGTFNRGLVHAQLLKASGIKFDLTKFSWLGSASVEGCVLAIRSDLPYKTFADLQKAKSPIILGSTGPSDSNGQFPVLLKEYFGLNMKMINYPSSRDVMLAIERKELDGRGGSYSSLKQFIDRGLLIPVIRGRVEEKGIEKLPVDESLTNDKRIKAILAMRSAADIFGRPYVAPPRTPEDKLKILRDAFEKVSKDPEAQQDAQKNLLTLEYLSAEKTTKVLNEVLSQPEDLVKEFGKIIKF